MKDFFTVFKDAENLTPQTKSFTTGEAAFELTAAQALKVGFRKAFNVIYFELKTPNTNAAKITATYTNEAGEQPLKIEDETFGFTKSGFIRFTRPVDFVASTHEEIEKHYVTLATDTDLSVGTQLKGVGIVFSTNEDLVNIRSNIVSVLNDGESLIGKIEAAKDEIIQKLNNQGHVKIVNDSSGSITNGSYFDNITEFDFLEIEHLRLASKYLSAALFYFEELSDEKGDKWEVQGHRHMKKFNEFFDVFLLKIDTNDDGQADKQELSQTNDITLVLD